MACHYSKPGAESACAGWVRNQIDTGNLGVRLAISRGRIEPPEADGPQHESFEDTLS
jgi:hypothetical protein